MYRLFNMLGRRRFSVNGRRPGLAHVLAALLHAHGWGRSCAMGAAGLLILWPIMARPCAFAADIGAADIGYVQQGRKCSHIKDRVQRLLCFDELFKSTMEQFKVEEVEKAPKKQVGPIRLMATVLERQRAAGETSWIMRARPWHQNVLLTAEDYEHTLLGRADRDMAGATGPWSAQSVDIFMTMNEADAAPGRPLDDKAILLLSCENDITTLGVLLPKPIRTLQANLSLSAGSGSLFKLNWRDVENGDVVIAGRGLESIDTIKTIANYSRVQLQVTYPEGSRSFVFDMHDLKDRLKPLRTACHW